MTLKHKPFIYLRHGETDWNLNGLAQGWTDIPLNQTGRDQAEASRPLIHADPPTIIAYSPLSRARETADIVNRDLDLPMIAISDLRECGFGDMEGQAIGPWFHEWLRGERVIPGAEPVHQFLARALIGINTALDLPGRVLIVAHGGVFRSIRQAAGFTDTGPIRNAHPIRLTPPEDGFSWRHDSPPTGP